MSAGKPEPLLFTHQPAPGGPYLFLQLCLGLPLPSHCGGWREASSRSAGSMAAETKGPEEQSTGQQCPRGQVRHGEPPQEGGAGKSLGVNMANS